MSNPEKSARYAEVAKEIASVIHGETNLVARMATVSNILHHAFAHYFWTGFYVVDADKPDELVIGPYQGTLGCLRIPFGKGVCGAAAASRSLSAVLRAFPKQSDLGTRQHIGESVPQYPQAHQ